MPVEDSLVSGDEGVSGHQRALVVIAVFAGFAGIVSTTGLVVAGQYVRLIVPVSLLSGLAFVLVGFVLAGRFDIEVSSQRLF